MKTSSVILLLLGIGCAGVGCWVFTHDPVNRGVSTTTLTSAELDGGDAAPPPPPRRQPKNQDIRDLSQDAR